MEYNDNVMTYIKTS